MILRYKDDPHPKYLFGGSRTDCSLHPSEHILNSQYSTHSVNAKQMCFELDLNVTIKGAHLISSGSGIIAKSRLDHD